MLVKIQLFSLYAIAMRQGGILIYILNRRTIIDITDAERLNFKSRIRNGCCTVAAGTYIVSSRTKK